MAVVLANNTAEVVVVAMTVVVADELVVHVDVEVTTAVAADEDTASILTLELSSAQK